MGCCHLQFVLLKMTDHVAKKVRLLPGVTLSVPYMVNFLTGTNGTTQLGNVFTCIKKSGFKVNRVKLDRNFSVTTDSIGLRFSASHKPLYSVIKKCHLSYLKVNPPFPLHLCLPFHIIIVFRHLCIVTFLNLSFIIISLILR
jgi:hypothetical protein